MIGTHDFIIVIITVANESTNFRIVDKFCPVITYNISVRRDMITRSSNKSKAFIVSDGTDASTHPVWILVRAYLPCTSADSAKYKRNSYSYLCKVGV